MKAAPGCFNPGLCVSGSNISGIKREPWHASNTQKPARTRKEVQRILHTGDYSEA